MRILNLVLTKKWFDMIASGKKKEEYRDINSYYDARLALLNTLSRVIISSIEEHGPDFYFKKFDVVRFRHGYQKNARVVTLECLGVKTGTGKPEWGAEPNRSYYIISLGKILS